MCERDVTGFFTYKNYFSCSATAGPSTWEIKIYWDRGR